MGKGEGEGGGVAVGTRSETTDAAALADKDGTTGGKDVLLG